ncbi:hypothetical protein EF847_01795 [Actinobacteria bacterium YIM 96077]|uniref:Type IV toxin-antitoxin system AbiEi family antitoxin domain-containing protein n=1 Tax=Phytoactinopolyspora halophila TaxID=1981511 RepID=A0A329R328_9ACTN|nr:type IV toxin-antitoxin system AbiEi family antitoxin domain-containing protein [Phytoactinopolyspora halophila]AYY11645.1 hypothetical protein EF847_01795 [Actinobacteria bacterium YIM 96077]RAW17922.1 hypothetical protein DPM12_03485 [Phytoactinopolyspora halophila]
MESRLEPLAAAQHSILFRSQLLAAGYSDDEISRRIRRNDWTAIRRGAYVETHVWDSLDAVQRHRVLTIAVVKQLKVPAVPSHVSAAVMLGMAVWDLDLTVVHVTRQDRHASRFEAGVMHHAARLPPSDLCVVDGITVTGPLRTAVDIARTAPFEQSVVVADGALARSGKDRDGLFATFERMRTWSGARGAGRVVEFADGNAESVGESRARVQFERIGLPRPRLQYVIQAPNGETFRPDFYFEAEHTLGEFDGRSKYFAYLGPGEDPAEVVWREKRREDMLRDMGYGVARLVWKDLNDDATVRERFRAAFERTRRSARRGLR